MSSTAGTATPVATSFVQALRSNETLYQAYTNEFVSSSDDAPPSSDDVTKFIQSQGYDTNLADVNAALASVSAIDLSFWQGDYNTQFIDEGSTGPRVVIQAGVVTVLGTQINNYTFNNFTLAWTDSTNTSNGQITFASTVGLNPQSDPTSPSLQSTQGQDDTSAGIANPYIGPQFQGFFWAQGRHQPSDANIWGRMGKFPEPTASASAVSSSQGPTEASTLPQWAGTYKIYIVDQTKQGSVTNLQQSTNLVTIDASGNVTVNGTTIIQPTFNNDMLEWTSDAGNQSNAILKMRDATVAASEAPFTGNQFAGQYWAKSDPQPATYNWYGYVNGKSAPSSNNTAGSGSASTSLGTPQTAVQDMNGWAALASLGSQAMNMYMQMKMGEAVIELLKKGLPLLWRGLKALFRGVNNLIQKFRGSAPEPTDAETELSPSGPVESGEPVEGKPVDPAEGGPEPDLNIEPAGDPVIEPPVIEPPIDPVNIPEVPAEEGLIPEIEGGLVDVIEGGLIAV
ncbi:unnamed protein product [Colletotrichum noveboracense]|uniref:Uncharacterized protein n=1 Tax=Colletotrichum noveboracense TaxID=2664923 RepID=A0A9W4RYK0_9PEZI|nr:hypothetical protein K456DRAFT_1723657 [Colletotrichum gloeosporioides 23]KAJ0267778.1 hypothetical protein COL940_014030 [Colletotrichum noveboracense]KAJ0272278.1 hypothetical protein CBS470a_012767 [Colletotrichum nupharicola]KAJ0299899.1 hypothetical protein Brms1b_012969 [Colletotrichum noveboracense]CAI0650768.1 unnamed protein product [Colletotrichum noveboracense]